MLIVVNSTEEDFETTDLELQGLKLSRAYAIDREAGKKRLVPYEKSGNKISIGTKNVHLTTQTFICYE